jgi:tol-pal system protein YbgF
VLDVTGMRMWSVAMLALAGCGAAATQRPTSGVPDATAESPVDRLAKSTEDQGRRIDELAARLSLLEQEARDWRERAASKPAETVRIGPRRPTPDPAFAPDADRGPVEVVRLYERERVEAPAVELPAAPSGVPGRLPVVPLPGARAEPAVAGGDESSAADEKDAFRTALRLVRERRWDEALQALQQFAARYPDGGLSASAVYWEGEVHYAQRRYGEALQAFERVLERFPASAKTADSMLKVGLCHRRLGDQAAAERYFRQLREQYPKSDAARIASREGSS